MIVSAFGKDHLLQLESTELLSHGYQFNVLHGAESQQDDTTNQTTRPGCRYTGVTYGAGYSPAFINLCTMVRFIKLETNQLETANHSII